MHNQLTTYKKQHCMLPIYSMVAPLVSFPRQMQEVVAAAQRSNSSPSRSSSPASGRNRSARRRTSNPQQELSKVGEAEKCIMRWLTSPLPVLSGVELEEATVVPAQKKAPMLVLIAQMGRMNELGLVVH